MATQENLFMHAERPITDWRPPTELPELSRYKRLGFDTEADGKNPFKNNPIGMSLCTPDKKRYYLPWAHKGGGNLDKELVKRWAQRELRDKDIVGLNIKFDNQMMINLGIDLETQGNRLHDVAFKAALINEHRYSGFSLESLAVEFLPEGERKIFPPGVEAKDFHLASAGEIAERAEQDAYLALRIDEETDPIIQEQNLGRVLELEDNLIYAVSHMERNGAPMDVGKLERWSKEAQHKYERLILGVYSQTGLRVNPDASGDMKRLFNYLGIPYSDTFDAPFLKNIAYIDGKVTKGVQNQIIADVFEARRMKSLKSKYLDKYLAAIGSDNLLRYSLHQLRGDEFGTVTGRFACANVNIQQVMKVEKQIEELGPDFIIRECFIPAKGKIWLSADASQIEFRLFAHYANSPHLTAQYTANPLIDFHTLVCEMILKAAPHFAPDVKTGRRRAKNINFGVIYGMGIAKLIASLGIDERAAGQLLDAYHAEFPEAKRLMNTAARLAEQRGWVKTLLGRRRRYPDKQRLHSALNAVIQGTAADYMKMKILELYRMRKELEFTMRLTVHDEVDGDVPSHEHAKRIKEILDTQSLPLRIPLLWDVETGSNWRLEEAA